MSDDFIYDSVPYPSFVFPQTNPDRLLTLAAAHGLEAADPAAARMLELGCGDGTNLLAHAYAMPSARFVGIDLSEPHIRDAKKAAAELGIANVEFHQLDVSHIESGSLGKFDAIVAHGLFSWVPEAVRESVLKLYSDCLAENGVGYISYNAFPGCHIRRIAGDILKYGARGSESAAEKVAAGLKLLETVAADSKNDNVYQEMLSLEAKQTSERTVSNVFHDDLSYINQPFYFNEFCDLLDDHGFQFLCEAEPTELALREQAGFDKFGSGIIEREQYRDLVIARRFRTTLFVRKGRSFEYTVGPDPIDKMLIAANLEPEDDAADIADASGVRYRSSRGNTVTVNHPLTKTALHILSTEWPQPVAFTQLVDQARSSVATVDEDDEAITRTYLTQMFKAGFVRFHRFAPEFVTTLSSRPEVSRFARWQLSKGLRAVNTFTGLNLEVEFEGVAKLLLMLDGTNDRESLIDGLLEYARKAQPDEEFDRETMAEKVDMDLDAIASAGLLIA